MQVTTTFTNLLENDISDDTILAIEGIVGARESYGLETPISVRAVLDAGDLSAALVCLENSVEDTRDLRVAIALDWVRAHLEPYLAFTGGNAAVEDLLTATDRFQSDAEGTPPDARFDYCGRPLGTGGVLPADTLLSEADRLAATLADLDDTPPSVTYYTIVPLAWGIIDGQPQPTPLSVVEDRFGPVLAGPVPDAATSTTILSYLVDNRLIEEVLADSNENYLTQSEAITQDLIANYPDLEPLWVAVAVTPPNGEDLTENYACEAARRIGTAAAQAARMAAVGAGSLSGVRDLIATGYALYRASRMLLFGPRLSRLYLIRETGAPPIGYVPGRHDNDAVDTAIWQAEQSERASALTDETYIRTFDVSVNGRLNRDERDALELAVRARMKAARQSAAAALHVTESAARDAALALTPDFETILRLYVD
jgi:hypothetical protein